MTRSRNTLRRAAAFVTGALLAALVAAAPAVADTYTQSANVTIPPSGNANPYPSELEVVDSSGLITDVNVTFDDPKHDEPDDLDVMLVSPSGAGVVLMSDACGLAGLEGDLRFDQDEPNDIADGDCSGDPSGRPRDYEPGETWPAAVAGNLDAFAGESANGTWRLYVSDDTAHGGEGDEFIDLWSLEITTREPAPVGFSLAALTVSEGDTAVVDVVRSGDPLYSGSITVATSSGAAVAGADFTPLGVRLDFAPGETTKRIEVPVTADGLGEAAQDFSIVLGNPEGDAAVGTPGAVGITIPADPGGPFDDRPLGDESKPPPSPFTRRNTFRRLPGVRRCRRPGQTIRFRPQMPQGVAIVRSEVFVNGRKIEDNIDEAAIAPIVLKMQGRRMRVLLRLTSHDKRILRVRRTFRRCKSEN